eukprot:6630605-Prymnesium_polylepis.1
MYSERIINSITHTVLKKIAPSDSARRDLAIDQIKKKSHVLTLPRHALAAPRTRPCGDGGGGETSTEQRRSAALGSSAGA